MSAMTARKPNPVLEAVERKRTLREEAQAKARAQDAWEEQAQRETMDLARQRGDDIIQADKGRAERRKPLRRISALDWLFNEGKLGDLKHDSDTARARLRAGDQYGDDYRTSEDVRVRSCLNDSVGGGEGPTAVYTKAKKRLVDARVVALQSHPGLIAVCDAICGIGIRPRQLANGAEREGIRNEQTLLIALDFLAARYGLTTARG